MLISAFMAGITFGAGPPGDVADMKEVGQLTELRGELLALAVWFLFGMVPVATGHVPQMAKGCLDPRWRPPRL